MTRKTEFAIFFISLAIIGVVVFMGISYFKSQEKPAGLLLGTAANVPSQNPQSPQNNIETIPTSTIIIPLAASSSAPVPRALRLPYAPSASTANGTYWPKAWGALSFNNNEITLIPDPTTHGADSFLNGASAWTNYIVTADASWLMGGSFNIVGRTTNNEQDFVYCEFGPNGTEIIERINSADTQIAYTTASTTAINGAAENFGMEVYGNDIGCTMNGHEVVGATVSQGESSTGGIGFVTFGQPAAQKGVAVSEISVTPLSRESIIVPFPSIPVAPSNPAPSSPPAPTANPISATTTEVESLPYSVGTFGDGFVNGGGWLNWWGGSSEANGLLEIMATASSTGGGALLQGSSAWTDYTFQATVDWHQGETFGLVARYSDSNNYVVCQYDEKNVGDVNVRLDQHLNGVVTRLADGDVLNYNAMGGQKITAVVQVVGDKGSCAFNGHVISSIVSSDSITPSLTHGGIGVTSWDSVIDNSQITITNIGVTTGIYSLGSYVKQTSE